jgi:hypothetical protein
VASSPVEASDLASRRLDNSLLRPLESRFELSLARALESGEARAASSGGPGPNLRSR